MTDLENLLKGGDLCSLGESRKVIALVSSQEKFDELFQILFHYDRKVVMRTADAIEKITVDQPAFLTSHKKELISLCSMAEDKELKWHLALLVSRLDLTKQELGKIWQRLTDWALQRDESRIVRVNAVQGLFNLLPQNKALKQDFYQTLLEIERENIPSLKARIKKLTKLSQ